MSYATDTDALEQSDQGSEQDQESLFVQFMEDNFGTSFEAMSNNEKDNAMFQWKLHQREKK